MYVWELWEYKFEPCGYRCLEFSAFDTIRICFNNSIIQYIPDEVYVEISDNTNVFIYVIYRNKYLLDISSPTEYLSISLNEKYSSDSKLIFKIYDDIIADINLTDIKPSNKIIIKFGNQNYKENEDLDKDDDFFLNSKCVGFKGVEDKMLKGCDVETLNFSRYNNVSIIAKNCEINSIMSAYYMSYYLPSELNDTMIPRYNCNKKFNIKSNIKSNIQSK
jgi:hypothetical protein